MANTWHLTEEEIDELDLPFACEDVETYNEGWTITREGIFHANDKYWRIRWDEGATEMQECEPWEYDSPVAVEVVPEEVTVIKWVEA